MLQQPVNDLIGKGDIKGGGMNAILDSPEIEGAALADIALHPHLITLDCVNRIKRTLLWIIAAINKGPSFHGLNR